MRIAVLGAGIQGACTALELARRGFEVDLFDREPRPVQRASRQNEGKIHLGFIFAKDKSRHTARLMVEGALRFRHLVGQFVPEEAIVAAKPFDYVVASDSMIPVEAVAEHFAAVDAIYQDCRAADTKLDYLGGVPDTLSRPLPLSAIDGLMRPGMAAATFRTEELAIDVNALADAVADAVGRNTAIRFRGNHSVDAVERGTSGFVVKGRAGDKGWQETFPQIVNALWQGRLAIDASVGVPLPAKWNYRLKLRVMCEIDRFAFADRSFTTVLGPYGDLVQYVDGPSYMSWYPACLTGWSSEVTPPASWDRIVRRQFSRDEELALARDLLAVAARDWIPALAEAKVVSLGGGIIVGAGDLDIDQHPSALHRRSEAGVFSTDGYHSISTGKYTTAPMFAEIAADRVAAAAG